MWISLYVICHFSIGAFNILSLSSIFVSLITMSQYDPFEHSLDVFLLEIILPGTLCFLDLVEYFLSHIRKGKIYYLSNIFSGLFSLSSPSGTPILWILMCLKLSQRSLCLHFFHLFFKNILFCSNHFQHSVLQVIYLFFFLSYSLLIPSSVLFICLFVL